VAALDNYSPTEWSGGTRRSFLCGAVPIPGERRVSGAIILLEETTEKVRLEAELAHAQKLEALGRLAGGVAHDLNNLLMVIFSLSEKLVPTVAPADARKGDLEEIRRAAESARALTAQLLAFGRRDVQRPRNVALEDVVAATHKMLFRVIGEHIEVVAALSGEPNTIWIDPVQLEQVIVNLAINARDAMPRGGKLTISTSSREGERGRVAMLRVTDTGIGMDDATLARIFEPFFTTKDRGGGSGLGLSAVHGIVERSGGAIRVRSTLGEGTTFEVDLPRSTVEDPPELEKAEAPIVPSSLEPVSNSILLVEDNAAVRSVVRAMLQSLGHQVTAVGDARAALAHFQTGARVDLLITDVILLGTSGRDLADTVGAQWPETRVLFISGYVDDEDLLEGRTSAGILSKPFTMEALTHAVGRALGR